MKLEIQIGISNRHIHLTKETYDLLFDKPLTEAKPLSQPGGFAANECVTLKTSNGIIEHVRIVGPHRKYNQVEISKSDAFLLKLNPPVRKSGDLTNAEDITVIGPKGSVELKNACILAERHIHISPLDAKKYHVQDEELVMVRIEGERSATLDAHIKITENAIPELHIDRDEGNALLIAKNQKAIIKI